MFVVVELFAFCADDDTAMSNEVTKSITTPSNSENANKDKIDFRIDSVRSFDYGFVRFLLTGRLGVDFVAAGVDVTAATGFGLR